MKIASITGERITFDNGNFIEYYHEADCCEDNYADFKQLDDIAKKHNFDENLKFEAVDGFGFRFGNRKQMFFVPCYSEQNGYYSSNIEIYYCKENGDYISDITFEAEFIER